MAAALKAYHHTGATRIDHKTRKSDYMTNKAMLLIVVSLVMLGCQKSEINELKNDLVKLETSLIAADKRIEKLQSLNDNLKQQIEKAGSKYSNLYIQKKDTDEWIGAIVKRIGPCVWGIGPFEKPMPEEIIPKATPKDLIAKLNKLFQNTNSPEATLVDVKDHIAIIKIVQDKKLTQEMGTFGASAYINSIVYTLYSVDEINCVNLDFEEGDHAFPGTYCPGMDHRQERSKNI